MARFTVNAGPSKLDLMLALFDSTCDKPRPVTFTVAAWPENAKPSEKTQPVTVHINSVQREDGSGESWNIDGRIEGGPSTSCSIYYSTRSRTGVLNT